MSDRFIQFLEWAGGFGMLGLGWMLRMLHARIGKLENTAERKEEAEKRQKAMADNLREFSDDTKAAFVRMSTESDQKRDQAESDMKEFRVEINGRLETVRVEANGKLDDLSTLVRGLTSTVLSLRQDEPPKGRSRKKK